MCVGRRRLACMRRCRESALALPCPAQKYVRRRSRRERCNARNSTTPQAMQAGMVRMRKKALWLNIGWSLASVLKWAAAKLHRLHDKLVSVRNNDAGPGKCCRRAGYDATVTLHDGRSSTRILAATVTPARLPELLALERIIELGAAWLETRVVCNVNLPVGSSYPVHVIALGNPSPDVPAVGFFGGVHGLERIGAGVVISYLQSLVMRLQWDSTLHRQLESVRLVFMPIVNPGGMALGTRANPNGVDLMRNAPVQAQEAVPFLVGGQRLSAGLPWYRGVKDRAMEVENRAVCDVVQTELLSRRFSLSID